MDYYRKYKKNKASCGRRKIILPKERQVSITEKVFDDTTLPMKGKWKPNGHQDRREKQAFKRNIAGRENDFPEFKEEFGLVEGDTIVGVHHKSAVITLVERLSKVFITLKYDGRKASDWSIR